MNQAQLGERMAELGTGWSRSTVVKLENYKRESLSISDLLALAVALKVSPVALLADPRHVSEVPITAEDSRNVWSALAWLIGADDPELPETALTLSVAVDSMARSRRLSGVRDRDGRLTRDPAAVAEVAEEQDRKELAVIQRVLVDIEKRIGGAQPEFPAWVRDRAMELDVDLPGQG